MTRLADLTAEFRNSTLAPDVVPDLIRLLLNWKADVENSIKAAMDEKCDAYERHCTCVPLLRTEVAELKAQLADTHQAKTGG